MGQQFMDGLEISRQGAIRRPRRRNFEQSEDRQPFAPRELDADAEERDGDQQNI